jgi:pantoate--beta-alanine ligase
MTGRRPTARPGSRTQGLATATTGPLVARSRGELARALAALRSGERRSTVAFVPTMGALHDGHQSLLARARELADVVVASIYVNPLQFGPAEDLDRYPRTWDADLARCAAEGVDLVFAPTDEVMYPGGRDGQYVTVSAGRMGEGYEGAHRPGHFDGVLTVVLKLFLLVQPDVAVFGEKDAQQLALIRRMVGDLDLPVHIVGAPTIRDADGLALSSRNRYLAPTEREAALTLSRGLRSGAAAAGDGPDAVRAAARAVLAEEPAAVVDYLELVDPATFTRAGSEHIGPALLVVAARVGTTRLIDNVAVSL